MSLLPLFRRYYRQGTAWSSIVVQTEVDYFLRLVEDLFLIAEMGQPRFNTTGDLLDLKVLIEEEVNAQEVKNSLSEKQIRWRVSFRAPLDELMIPGDRHLIQRLLRNSFDNAWRYAAEAVSVSVFRMKIENSITAMISDDGPGMSEQAIQGFGTRRPTRIAFGASKNEVSLGLGSVIIQAILRLHRGRFEIKNRSRADPSKTGTELKLILPR